MEHTGAGQITVTNADLTRAPKEYAVFTLDGTPVPGTSYSNGVISMGDVFGEYKIADARSPRSGTPFVRLAITTHPEQRDKCDPCNPHCEPGCGGPGSPTCNPPGQDNDACYSCCWGCGPGDPRVTGQCCCSCSPNCYKVTVQVKDAVPAGYTEKHGEWMKITNPVVKGKRLVEEEGIVPFAPGDWPEDYYISFPTPEKTLAQIELASEDNPEPAKDWVFDYTIFLTFFDEDGNIYLNVDSKNEPECFIFTKGDGVTTFTEQEVWIQNIPSLVKGTYEATWLGTGVDEELPHTDIGNTYTLIKELSGNVG